MSQAAAAISLLSEQGSQYLYRNEAGLHSQVSHAFWTTVQVAGTVLLAILSYVKIIHGECHNWIEV